jgi:hypothetical protein
MWNAWEKQEMCTLLQWENLKERGHFTDLGIAQTIEIYLQEIE